ncbi:hypothetical protein [Nocardia jinanensis]|uniref:Uncharacterized protein n=1 Tax=Nocardia jinanensis TaxID=382504 RepID=A0A917RJ21_9NOCA|nr:hypothetical protein [Nocardia jinanensis]GGL08459.1 hypothetical protein GCM10011588_23460 [Nocardia jinanensis]
MTAAEIRARIERDSTANRYVNTAHFAESAGVEPRQISRWLHTGTVWVPRPAVLLGRAAQPGWEPAAIVDWTPGLPGVDRPEPIRHLSTPEMAEKWHTSPQQLWIDIGGEFVPAPDLWLGGRPGWRP